LVGIFLSGCRRKKKGKTKKEATKVREKVKKVAQTNTHDKL